MIRPGSDLQDGLRGWDRGQHSIFSEYGYVAYQKGNDTCSNMEAIILPTYPPPPTLGVGSKLNFFSEPGHVAHQTKGMAHAATW